MAFSLKSGDSDVGALEVRNLPGIDASRVRHALLPRHRVVLWEQPTHPTDMEPRAL